MQKIIRISLVIALLATVLLSACTKDSNTIPAGTDIRAAIAGNWLVNEQYTKNTYEVTLSKDTASTDGVLINNFGASGVNVTAIAYLSGTTLNLKTNELLSNGWVVNGSGTLSGTSKIIWVYTIHDGANQINAQATYLKQ
jgi:hypothetical protein